MLRQLLEGFRAIGIGPAAGLILGAAAVGAALGTATAQNSPTPPASKQVSVPADAADAAQDADRPRVELLLDRLSGTASARSASRIERQIMADWVRSESDTVNLLMEWAAAAMKAKENKRALDYLDRVVKLAPDFPEGWNRRATVLYMLDDYGRAISDIGRVLALQPRHFGALNGLGLVLDDIDQHAAALSAFRRALAVHPFLDGTQKRIDRLERDVEGLPI